MSEAHSEYSLRVISGEYFGREYPLYPGQGALIGSDPRADIELPDRGVAPHHARIHCQGEAMVVEALAKAPLRVNGDAKARAPLSNGDQLGIGDAILRVTKRARTPARERNGMPDSPRDPRAPSAATASTSALERHLDEPLEPRRMSEHERKDAIAKAQQARLWWSWNELPPLELQHIWFELSRDEDWRSLAVVPTDSEVPAVAVAHGFARMASLNPAWRVLMVDASPGDEKNSAEKPLIGTVASAVMRYPGANYDFLDAKSLGLNEAEVAHLYIPQLLDYIGSGSRRHNKVIIALGPLIEHARSIPIARAVEAVVLAVGLGDSRIPEVRRAIDIVGKQRVRGTFVVAVQGDRMRASGS